MSYEVGRCRLHFLRTQRGLTQQELSERSGINVSNISSYETNDRMMTLPTANALADALGCRIDDLYEFKRS